MKIFRILLCAAFVVVISACHGKGKNVYEYPIDDPTDAGNIGDPCTKNEDCKSGLVCLDKVCSQPVTDNDADEDSDIQPDEDGSEPADDADSDTQHDEDKDISDTEPTDDSDTGTTDEDGPEDSDTRPDNDADNPEYIPECGNGARDPGEECDNGAANSDEPGIPGVTCRTDCLFARCQDGIKDEGEVCDDGNAGSGYCSMDCHVITGYCGDGIKQLNEECDKALNPYCADDCSEIAGSCGDGKINGNEVCDNAEPDVGEGEGTGPYYCNVSCSQILGSCGDGIVQLNEECDDKNNNGRYGYCKSDCSGKGPYCGDGIVQSNEACDKAAPEDGGGEGTGLYCSSDCKTSKGSCGDGIIQEGIEACDKATFNQGTGVYCADDCSESFGRCGDGITVEGIEECDNGDSANDNPYCPYGTAVGCEVCNRACRIQAGIPRYCGDGVVSTLYNEVCDPANTDDPKRVYCKSDCSQYIGYCGDGILQEGIENCDPGIEPYCSSDCKTISGSCGDGIVQEGAEECDNGGNNGNTACPYGDKTACTVCSEYCRNTAGTPRYCGDGLLDEGYEICDSGSSGGNYGECRTDCSGLAEHCGDGIVQEDAGEECDNGENNGKTTCVYGEESCKVCTKKCKETDGQPVFCGDGVIQREDCTGYGPGCVVTAGVNESCDDGGHNGEYGYCKAGCYGDGERCGDGIRNGDEVCDDGEANNGKYGFCASDCMSLGRRCGDGIVETANGEFCDDGENNGKYKNKKPGYCNADCQGYGEGGYCGDSSINEGIETCDNGSNNNLACNYGETSCDVCNPSCIKQPGTTSYCGDGVLDWRNDEVCDKGSENTDYNGECNKECSGEPPKCGDGNTDEEFGEVCDDRNNNGKYGLNSSGNPYCSGDCKSFGGGGYCGDGTENGYETCDSGAMNGHYGNFCNETCTGYTHYCGDANLDSADGENCDDGSFNGTYGKCDSNCQEILECGDGIWQNKNCLGAEGCVELDDAEEQCDLGIANGTATDCVYGEENCTLCTASCMAFEGNTAYCNDGILQREDCEGRENCVEFPGANEECDDGERNGEYGYCAAGCGESMPKCGDGKINRENCDGYGENCVVTEGVNEECDDGNDNGTYGKCNINCSGTVRCGDGVATDGELCDNGVMNGTYNFCNETCTGKTGECGDGILHKGIGACGGAAGCVELETANEECDDGSFNYDHVIDCDYGEENCTYCTKTCAIAAGNTSFCGDGEIDTANGEVCDEGKALNGQFGHCDKFCKEIVTWQCGDGSVDSEHGEVCDDGILNNTDGHCNATCDGWTPYCGDGIIQRADCRDYENCMEVEGMTEECDDGGNNGQYGFCKADCSGKREERCGDGIIHRSECIDYSSCDHKPCSDPSHTSSCRKIGENDNGDDINCDDIPNCSVVPGAFENCDEGADNGLYYGHCNEDCSGTKSNGYCGDYRVQMASNENCAAWLAEDPSNRTICSESNTTNCCEVVAFAPGEETLAETCDEAENNGYHGHCNEICDGISSCGDGEVGKDEICEPGDMEEPFACAELSQFKGNGIIRECDNECMPIITECANADFYRSPFFETGQTECYDNSAEITPSCPTSGDFYGQEPNFHYTEHEFETIAEGAVIKEKVSGLFWQKETPDRYGFEKDSIFYPYCVAETSCTYEEAKNYCSTLGIGGYNDWRLPTVSELATITDYSAAQHIYSGFTNTTGRYWTKEGLLFSSADGTFSPTSTDTPAQIKCVHDKEAMCPICGKNFKVLTFSNFIITAINENTFVFWYLDNTIPEQSWKNALAVCQGIDFKGLNKMRLPTVNELITLIDTVNGGSLISGFTGTAWTSTTWNNDVSQAYVVDFSSLNVTTAPKTNSNYVICVE